MAVVTILINTYIFFSRDGIFNIADFIILLTLSVTLLIPHGFYIGQINEESFWILMQVLLYNICYFLKNYSILLTHVTRLLNFNYEDLLL